MRFFLSLNRLSRAERELLVCDIINNLSEGKFSSTEVAFDLMFVQSGILKAKAAAERLGKSNFYRFFYSILNSF